MAAGEEFEIETKLIIDDSSLTHFVSNWTAAVDKIRRAAVDAGSGLGLSSGAIPALDAGAQQDALGAVTSAQSAGLIGADSANHALELLTLNFATLTRTVNDVQARLLDIVNQPRLPQQSITAASRELPIAAAFPVGRAAPIEVREVDPTAAARLAPNVVPLQTPQQVIQRLAPAVAATRLDLLPTAIAAQSLGAIRDIRASTDLFGIPRAPRRQEEEPPTPRRPIVPTRSSGSGDYGEPPVPESIPLFGPDRIYTPAAASAAARAMASEERGIRLTARIPESEIRAADERAALQAQLPSGRYGATVDPYGPFQGNAADDERRRAELAALRAQDEQRFIQEHSDTEQERAALRARQRASGVGLVGPPMGRRIAPQPGSIDALRERQGLPQGSSLPEEEPFGHVSESSLPEEEPFGHVSESDYQAEDGIRYGPDRRVRDRRVIDHGRNSVLRPEEGGQAPSYGRSIIIRRLSNPSADTRRIGTERRQQAPGRLPGDDEAFPFGTSEESAGVNQRELAGLRRPRDLISEYNAASPADRRSGAWNVDEYLRAAASRDEQRTLGNPPPRPSEEQWVAANRRFNELQAANPLQEPAWIFRRMQDEAARSGGSSEEVVRELERRSTGADYGYLLPGEAAPQSLLDPEARAATNAAHAARVAEINRQQAQRNPPRVGAPPGDRFSVDAVQEAGRRAREEAAAAARAASRASRSGFGSEFPEGRTLEEQVAAMQRRAAQETGGATEDPWGTAEMSAAANRDAQIRFEIEKGNARRLENNRVTAYRGDRMVGSLQSRPDTGEIAMVAVDQEEQRKGIATGMMEHARALYPRLGLVPPEHSPSRTLAGDAWARSVGGNLPDIGYAAAEKDLMSEVNALLTELRAARAQLQERANQRRAQDERATEQGRFNAEGDPWGGITSQLGGGGEGPTAAANRALAAKRKAVEDAKGRIAAFSEQATQVGGVDPATGQPLDFGTAGAPRAGARGAFLQMSQSVQEDILNAGLSDKATQSAQKQVVEALQKAAERIDAWSRENYTGAGVPKPLSVTTHTRESLASAGPIPEVGPTEAPASITPILSSREQNSQRRIDEATAIAQARTDEALRLARERAAINVPTYTTMVGARRDANVEAQRLREEKRTEELRQRMEDRINAGYIPGGGGGSGRGGFGGGILGGLGLGGGGGFSDALQFGFAFQIIRQGIGTVAQFVTSAEELQQALVLVNQQLVNTGRGGQFTQAKADILSISADVGVAGTVVATVEQQFLGLYQNATTAGEATRAAFEFAKVAGLDLSQGVSVLSATTLAYGVSVEAVADKVTGLSQRFGVSRSALATGISTFAPVAAQSGLSLEQTGALVAGTAQASGQSVTQVTQGFDRLFPQLQAKAVQIVQLFQYSGNAAAQALVPVLNQQLGSGQTGAAVITLIENYKLLGAAGQNLLNSIAGGPRQAQFLIAAFERSGAITKELAGNFNDAGKSQSAFAAFQDTLKQQLDRISQSFKNLGVALLDAGIGQIFIDGAAAVNVFLSALKPVITLFGDVNKATGGFLGQLIAIGVAVKAFSGVSAAGGILSGLLGGGTKAKLAGQAESDLVQTLGTSTRPGLGSLFSTIVGGAGTEGLTRSNWLTAVRQRMSLQQAAAGIGPMMPAGQEASVFSAVPIALPLAVGATLLGVLKSDNDKYNAHVTAYRKTLVGTIDDTIKKANDDVSASLVAAATQNPAALPATGPRPSDPSIFSVAFWNRNIGQASKQQRAFDEAKALNLPGNQRAITEAIALGGAIGTAPGQISDKEVAKALGIAGGGDSRRDGPFGAFVRPTTGAENLDALVKKAQAGDQKALDRINSLTQLAIGDPKISQVVKDALVAADKSVKEQKDAANKATAESQSSDSQQTVSDLQADLAAGAISLTDFLTAVGKDTSSLQGLIAGQNGNLAAQKVLIAQWKADLKATSDAIAQGVTSANAFNAVLNLGPAADANTLASVLHGPLAGKLTADQLEKFRIDYLTAMKNTATSAMNNATSLGQIQDLMAQPIPVDMAAALNENARQRALRVPDSQLPFAYLQAVQNQNAASEAAIRNQSSTSFNPRVPAPNFTFKQESPHLSNEDRQAWLTQNNLALPNPTVSANEAAGISAMQLLGTQSEAAASALGASSDAIAIIRARTDKAVLKAAQDYQKANPLDPTAGPAVAAALAAVNTDAAQHLADMNADALSAIDNTTSTNLANANLRRAGTLELNAIQTQGDQAHLAALKAQDALIAAQGPLTGQQQTELVNAQNKVLADQAAADQIKRDNLIALNQANTAYGVALANSQFDPQAAAQATLAGAIQARQTVLTDPKSTDAQKKQSQTDVLNAQAGVIAATNARVQAQYDVAIAMANAGGDPVGAAAGNVAKLQAAIQALRAAGSPANSTPMLTAQAQYISAQAAYVQQQITTAENLIQTDVTLHRITIGGAIERLKQLKQLATNQVQMDQIQVQIQQLLTQAGSDLSFNISSINLPTLYEVRRLNATPTGVGYSDNRQFSIQLNISSQLDLMGAMNSLAQVVGVSSSRFGVTAQTR